MQDKIIKYFLLSIFFSYFSLGSIYAQYKNDTLFSKLKTAKTFEDSIFIYNGAFDILIEQDTKEAGELANKILQLSQQHNYKKGIAIAYGDIAMNYYTKGDYQQSIKNHLISIKIKEEIKAENSLAVSYNNIALVYNEMSEYEKAISYYHKSLKIKEKLHKDKDICIIYNNIGLIYASYENYDKALEYFEKSYTKMQNLLKKEPENIAFKNSLASYLLNIGSMYYSKKDLNSALLNFKKSASVFEQTKNRVDLGVCYGNIGTIYYDQEKYDYSMDYHKKALTTLMETGDSTHIASTYRDLADDFLKHKNYDQAVTYYHQSLNLSLRLNDIEEIKETCFSLSKLYEQNQDFKNSLKYYKLYTDAKDSIFDKESQKIFNEIQTKYETEKKNEQIQDLSKDKELKEKKLLKLRFILGISIFVLLIFCFFTIRYYRKYQENKKVKELLVKQKNTILTKLAEYESKHNIQKQQEKYAHSKLSDKERNEIYTQLLKYLEDVKIFLNDDITLPSLAKQLSIPVNLLSQTINSKLNLNFNDFINSFRIEEAKKRLTDKEFQNLTFEAIGKSVGFNSRTSFISAFKKFTSFTPSEYKKANILS
jgi:tetratricopeptide (TPR) repeat protein